MKISQQSLERAKHRPHPMAEHLRHDVEEQLELGDFPLMTANRAKDFGKCKRCQLPCDYCLTPSGADETPDFLVR